MNKYFCIIVLAMVISVVKATEKPVPYVVVNEIIVQSDTTIQGTVLSLENGKDGFTAKIITKEKEVYYATVSPVNLGDNFIKMRRFSVGEIVVVKGELWILVKEKNILVRDIL